jgi:T5SS/PEP-CTERM-associated repeat protein
MTQKYQRTVTRFMIAAAASATLAGSALGVTFSWTNAGGGTWGTAANWSPAGGPPNDAADVAVFNLFAAYDVTFGAPLVNYTNLRFDVTTGSPTLLLWQELGLGLSGANTYTLAATSGGAGHIGSVPGAFFPASLTIEGGIGNAGPPFGGPSTVQASSFLHIGRDANSDGILSLNNTNWTSTGNTFVGLNGDGTMNISQGAVMENALGVLGFAAGSRGVATIGGRWENNAGLTVGALGSATVTLDNLIANNSVVCNGDLSIATGAGGSGFFNVIKGRLSVVGSGFIGAGGTGTLIVHDRADVSQNLTLHSNGRLTVGSNSSVGSMAVGQTLQVNAGGSLNLAGGTFSVGSLSGATNTMNWTGGRLNVTSDGLIVGPNAPLGPNENIGPGKTLSVSGGLSVGSTGSGSLTLFNGVTTTTGGGFVGNAGAGTTMMTVSGAGTRWVTLGSIQVGGLDRADLVIGAGAVVQSGSALVAPSVGRRGDVTLLGADSMWHVTGLLGDAHLGGAGSLAGGTGTTSVSAGATLRADTAVVVWNNYNLVVGSGGILETPNLEVRGTASFSSDLIVDGAQIGALSPRGGTINAPLVDITNGSLTGFGVIDAPTHVAGNVTATGNLTIGDSDSFDGVVIDGALNVGSHTVTLLDRGFIPLRSQSTITGGTLIAPGGLIVPGGDNIIAAGEIRAPLVISAGATVVAQDNPLTLGSTTAVNGFYSNGVLEIDSTGVTLSDANAPVFDAASVVRLSGVDAEVFSSNGLVLNFGGNIQGTGDVTTPNNPAKPLINNGNITGDAPGAIGLTGYVKGVGSIHNVNIVGTYAPGFSPATVYNGAVEYAGRLEIDLAGFAPGTQHDVIHHTAAPQFGGDLKLILLNNFLPLPGDAFAVMSYPSQTGVFNILPVDGYAGLHFNAFYGPTILTLSATGLPGDADLDGDVDVADLGALATNWQSNANWLGGDFDFNGTVNVNDLGLLATNWQAGVGGPLSPALDEILMSLGLPSVAVPEPAGLLLCGGSGLCLRRRRARG